MLSGKFVADFNSFFAAVEKAEVSLTSFQTKASTVGSSLNKMVDSFSGTKLIQDAGLMAEAFERLGKQGIGLTSTELQRMGTTADAAIAKLRAMGQEIPAGIQKISDEAKKANQETSDWLGNMGEHVKAAALGFISAQAVIGVFERSLHSLMEFVESSVHAWAEQELATKKMTAALIAQGTVTPELIEHYKELGEAFQRTTVSSHTATEGMEALLVEIGNVAPTEMKRALQAANDLSSGLGIDLETATRLVGKAFAGSTGTLSRYGIVIDEAKIKSEGVEAVLDAIQKKFGGQAQAEVESYSGRVKQLGNAWEDFKEQIGGAFASNPVVIAAIRSMTDGTLEASKGTGALNDAWEFYVSAMPSWLRAITQLNHDLTEQAEVANAAAEAAERMNAVPPPKAFEERTSKSLFADHDAEMKAHAEAEQEQWKKTEAAAKKYGEAVEAAFKKWSGADAAEQVKILDTVFRRLADSGQITEKQLRDMADAAAKLSKDGAELTPRLFAIVEATDALLPKLDASAISFSNLGEKIEISIPKLSEFNQAVNELNKHTTVGFGSLDFGFKVSDGFAEAAKGAKKTADEIAKLAQSFSQLANVAGGTFGGIVQGFATIIAAADTAAKGVASIQAGQAEAHKEGGGLLSTIGGIASIASGYGAIASAAIMAGKAIAGMFSTKGRDVVEDFAKMEGGFDALHAKLLALPDGVGEAFWTKLTQDVNRKDEKGAQAVVADIQTALAKAAADTPAAAAAAAGYKTTEELQAIAKKAGEVYDYMVKSGKYTASQIADAFKAMQEATATSLGMSLSDQKSELDAITQRYAGTIDALQSEWDSLNKSVGQEAEEAVMGVQETRDRERLKQVTAEKAAQEQMRDAEIAAKKSTFDQMLVDGTATFDQLKDVYGKGLEIPYTFVPTNSPDGGGGYAPSATSSRSRQTSTIVIEADGRQIAEAVVPHIPGAVQRYGLS